jgi:hypothetical protein
MRRAKSNPEVVKPVTTIEELLAEWQKRLKLQDWEIKISFKREYDMDEKLGSISWSHNKKQASLDLLDPIDYPPTSFDEYDTEAVIVHELLHLHTAFTARPTEGWEEVMEERAINAISKALVNAKRGL